MQLQLYNIVLVLKIHNFAYIIAHIQDALLLVLCNWCQIPLAFAQKIFLKLLLYRIFFMLNMLTLITFNFHSFLFCLFLNLRCLWFTMCDLMFEIKKYLNTVSNLHYSMLRSVHGLMLRNFMCHVEFFP